MSYNTLYNTYLSYNSINIKAGVSIFTYIVYMKLWMAVYCKLYRKSSCTERKTIVDSLSTLMPTLNAVQLSHIYLGNFLENLPKKLINPFLSSHSSRSLLI